MGGWVFHEPLYIQTPIDLETEIRYMGKMTSVQFYSSNYTILDKVRIILISVNYM